MKKLNLGSGKIMKEGFVNVDLYNYEGIDKAFNFEKFPYPFQDNKFDYIETKQVLEHLENTLEVLEELHRIMKKDAILHIEVPYFRGIDAYAITHKKFFTIKMFRILTGEIEASSKINKGLFNIKNIRLKFRLLYRIMGIHLIPLTIYEEFLSQIFPATDIIVRLKCVKEVRNE